MSYILTLCKMKSLILKFQFWLDFESKVFLKLASLLGVTDWKVSFASKSQISIARYFASVRKVWCWNIEWKHANSYPESGRHAANCCISVVIFSISFQGIKMKVLKDLVWLLFSRHFPSPEHHFATWRHCQTSLKLSVET